MKLGQNVDILIYPTQLRLAHFYDHTTFTSLYLAEYVKNADPTHWVNLRLTIHARSSAIETPRGARTVQV